MPTTLESNALFESIYLTVESQLKKTSSGLGREDREDLLQETYLYLWIECCSSPGETAATLVSRAITAATLSDSDYDLSEPCDEPVKVIRSLRSISKEYICPISTLRRNERNATL
jgi:hypothetical protein